MTTYIIDRAGNSAEASAVTVPSNRHFREAWTLSGNVISEDLTTAKAIFKDKIREIRKSLLDAQDVAYMRAIEADDADGKSAAVAAKVALRNAQGASAITDASTIAELVSAWDTSVLGDSPYAD